MSTLVYGTVCNAEQYDQSQVFRNNEKSSPPISCLSHGESIGLALTAEASLISCISVIVIFIWIGWNVRWYRKTFPNGDWKLFQGPADVYMFSLFVFDFLQAMGGVLDVRWAHNGIVTTGHYCTAQGIIQQIGEVGVALITLLLAVHTFVAALWQVGLHARGVALGMVCLACLFITLWVAIGADVHKNYETPTPYWCWISPKSRGGLGGEYIWLWIALFASAIYISPIFWQKVAFVDEGAGTGFAWRPDQRVEYTAASCIGMLLYPLHIPHVLLSPYHDGCYPYHDVPSRLRFSATYCQPIRRHQCAPVLDCQTSLSFSPVPRIRRARHGTCSSRYWFGNFLRCSEIPTQPRADIGCAGGG
ncbi:hypothetical protein BGY98DRAFT_1181975 [Russula aff. rugulosa BPL654]|nr:hypothetical protein BGY98DRAFT_1181975 [Russula aff. rugulosa BPL654]